MVDFAFYDRPGAAEPFSCTCGWEGTFGDLRPEMFRTLTHYECPGCLDIVCCVPFPTDDETAAAAGAGNPEAIAAMRGVERRAARSAHPLLTRADQLPDLPSGPHRLIQVDQVDEVTGDEDHGPWVVVTVGGTRIWSQPAFWDGIGPFEQLLDALWARYGTSVSGVEVSPAARQWVLGDDASSIRRLGASLTRWGSPAS